MSQMTEKSPNKVEEPMGAYYSLGSTFNSILQILGGFDVFRQKIKNNFDFIRLSKEGLPIGALTSLQQKMRFTNKEFSHVMGMSESTLIRRYKTGQILDKSEAQNAIQIASIWAKGLEVFEPDDFKHWLDTKNQALGGLKPVNLLDTPLGREQIKDLLLRIEWGIYS